MLRHILAAAIVIASLTAAQAADRSIPPECQTLLPAPTRPEAIAKFIRDEAIPLRSGDTGATHAWELQPLIDAFGSKKVFFLGEAHGSNEFGIVSARLLEALVRSNRINAVAFEAPMDFDEDLQNYVETGSGSAAQIYRPIGFGDMPQYHYWVTLPEAVRRLAATGIRVRMHPTDFPIRTQPVLDKIKAIATRMTASNAALVFELLPPPTTVLTATPEDAAKADTFYERIQSKKGQLCLELSERDCERLVSFTTAVWVSANSLNTKDFELFARRREELTFANFRALIMTHPNDRVYMHVGVFHGNKLPRTIRGLKTIAGMLSYEFPWTKGEVFSVAPAFGAGSVAAVDYSTFPPKDVTWPSPVPVPLIHALSDSPSHPLFISAVRPGKDCRENPLRTIVDEAAAEHYPTELKPLGEMFDGFIHYGVLTSDRHPKDTKLADGD